MIVYCVQASRFPFPSPSPYTRQSLLCSWMWIALAQSSWFCFLGLFSLLFA